MREVAQFYLNYVTYDTEGKMQLIPSVSPENTPQNHMPEYFHENMGHICPAVKNATMDFAVMKELLTNLLEGISVTGLYCEETDKYRNLLNNIPPYQINKDGAVKEWMSPELTDNYYHRHLSHIYPVFPGNELNAYKHPELFSAFRQAVHLRELGGQSGWSLTHMANIYACMGEGEQAMECLGIMAKSVVNNALVTTHNDWRHMGMTLDLENFAPIQLDANFGAVNAIQEMLFRYSEGYLCILPSCSGRMTSGTVKGIVYPHGTVDFSWQNSLVRVTIHAHHAFEADILLGDKHMERHIFKETEQFTAEYRL